jgi:hypothetical protein
MKTTPPRTAWLSGLLLGILNGFLLFEFPTLALVLVLASALLLTRPAAWSAGLGGLAVGVGGLWTFVLWQAQARCDAFNAVPNQGCEMPTIDGYLVAGILVAAAGLGLTIHAWRRRPPENTPSQDPPA